MLPLVAFFISLLISLIVVPEVIRNFIKNEVYDIPGGRKVHGSKTPSLGGIGIFVALAVTTLFFVPSSSLVDIRYLMLALILIFFMGVRDDLIGLSPNNKLIIQLLASIVVVGFGKYQLSSLYGLLPFPELPDWAEVVLTTFVLIVMTNAFNLIDGINGLAGGVALTILIALGTYFYFVHEVKLAVLCASGAGGVLGFLRYNWNEARVFMGDTGSMVLGFLITLMLISFLNVNESLDESSMFKVSSPVSICLALVIYPVFDTTRIVVVRLKNGKSPFKSDKKHIHHILLRTGASHQKIAVIAVVYTLFWLGVTYGLSFYLSDFIIFIIIGCSFVLIPLFLNFQLKSKTI